MKNNLSKRLVKTAFIAAIYAVITIILAPISYGPIQFRLSEILVLLAFINPFYIGGLTLGCLIANIFGGFGLADIVLGTFATFLSVSAISLTGKILKDSKFSLFIASIWPTIFNALIIGWMLKVVVEVPIPMSLAMIQVGFGEFVVVSVIGVPIAKILFKYLKED
ncbi:QueT transporter family protein [Clostridium carnis]